MSLSTLRYISESLKKKVAGKQIFRCANHPTANLRGIGNFKCPYWRITGDGQGNFDESGYEIDHIIEYSLTKDNREENLQALCYPCHRVKTNNFLREKKCYTINIGDNTENDNKNIDGNIDEEFNQSEQSNEQPIKNNHDCDLCGRKFEDDFFLFFHTELKLCSDDILLDCDGCPKRFASNKELLAHKKKGCSLSYEKIIYQILDQIEESENCEYVYKTDEKKTPSSIIRDHNMIAYKTGVKKNGRSKYRFPF